jgi:hypothetical protein
MKTKKQETTRIRTIKCPDEPKRVMYYPGLEDELPGIAEEIGFSADRLRRLSEMALRTRRHEAYIEHKSNMPFGRRPAVFTINLGRAWMYFTVEREVVLIRGYGWDIDHEPLHDGDGGGFYCDYWSGDTRSASSVEESTAADLARPVDEVPCHAPADSGRHYRFMNDIHLHSEPMTWDEAASMFEDVLAQFGHQTYFRMCLGIMVRPNDHAVLIIDQCLKPVNEIRAILRGSPPAE